MRVNNSKVAMPACVLCTQTWEGGWAGWQGTRLRGVDGTKRQVDGDFLPVCT